MTTATITPSSGLLRNKKTPRKIWRREIWKLIKPRRWFLVGCCLLIIVNRFCSFAVPVSSRYLINNVMYLHQLSRLPLIIGAVAGATLIQAVTTYILDRYLAVTGQQLIAELRMKVQQHVGRLHISFYDQNRTGTLVARIMSDVEGIRNLIGAGFLDLVGGIFTAIFALAILIRISAVMTALTFAVLIAFAWFLRKAFGITRPIFRERARINAEVTGRLTESLGAVRVVKGYRAEESEAHVFAEGADRLFKKYYVFHKRASRHVALFHRCSWNRWRSHHVSRRQRGAVPPSRYRRLCRIHSASGFHGCARCSNGFGWHATY